MKNIDVASMLGAVDRSVRSFEKDGRPAAAVVLTRTYDTSADDLWDAVTNAERLPRWFAPVDGDLKLGGKYQVKGNAGGTITTCDPPKRFTATWEFGGGVSWIDVGVAPENGKARLTLEHTAFIEEHWEKFGPGAVGIGWELGLLGLALYLAAGSPEVSIPAEATDWGTSDNAKDFMRGSGKAWAGAHAAGGADKADADAKAARTIAFYCGEPPPETGS
jgi:uncharacterized protein YndB with AHSA1/START domain